jgi:hypothetical protein
MAQLRMIEEIGNVLSRTELLSSYRRADQYAGDRASQSDLESLRLCGRIVLDKLEKLHSVEEELIGGTLEEEVNHFEARQRNSYGARPGTYSSGAIEDPRRPAKCTRSETKKGSR